MENNPMAEQEFDINKKLQLKFPGIIPVKKAPSMGTFNSFGVSIYGQSNLDKETNTYTKNLAICALFIPIFFLGAYRVADAPGGGWYFYGKEKLSKFNKNWNYIVLLLLCGLIGQLAYNEYINSPEYILKDKMAEAEKIYLSGDTKKTLQRYYAILDDGSFEVKPALDAIHKIYENDLIKLSKEDFLLVWKNIEDRVINNRPFPSKIEFLKLGNKHFERFQSTDLITASKILELMAEGLPADQELAKKSQVFKISSFEKEPLHLPFAIAKAKELETANEIDKCEAILKPLKNELKVSEGARILGNIYYQKGLYSEAYELLKPYFDSGLGKYHLAEKQYKNVYKQVADQANNALDSGQAGANWESKYQKSNENEKNTMVDEYIFNFISKSPAFIAANKKLNEHSDVINVALQLGIVLLNIANQSSGEEKINRLKEAEKIFISVQGVASESDDYQLTYGEILYWLNRPIEGEKQFNNFLEKHKSNVQSLYTIAQEYKSIGDLTKARELLDKAYNTSQKKEEKETIATARSAISIDLDDNISWLEKTNQNSHHNKASILTSKGEKKEQEGDFPAAEKLYREAIEVHEKIPDDSSKLNNMSLTYSTLFGISHEVNDLQKSVDLLKKSRDIDPKNTTILRNYTSLLRSLSILEEINKDIILKKINGLYSSDHIWFNATNQAEKDKDILKLTENSNFQKAIPLCEQLALLAPQSKENHFYLYDLYLYKKDLVNIKKILDNISGMNFNNVEYKKNTLENYSNKDNEKDLMAVNKRFKIYEGINIDQLNPDDVNDIISASNIASFISSRDSLGKVPPDFSSIILFLEKSYKKTPREFVLRHLSSFYLYQGLNEIYLSNEVYKKEVGEHRFKKYSFDHAVYILNKFPELKSVFINNTNIIKLAGLVRERFTNYPMILHITGLTFLIILDMDKDNKFKEQLLANPFLKPEIEFKYKLYPLSMEFLLEKYFYLNLIGDAKAAKEIIELAIKEGIPL